MALTDWTRPGAMAGGMRVNIPDRMAAIEQLRQAYPGRDPGGNGPTGLNSNDSAGWGRMLDEQREYQDYARGGDTGNMPVTQVAMRERNATPPPITDPYSEQELGSTNPTTGYREPVQGLINAYGPMNKRPGMGR
jgi:hypothetical protein